YPNSLNDLFLSIFILRVFLWKNPILINEHTCFVIETESLFGFDYGSAFFCFVPNTFYTFEANHMHSC
ncbi:uncharacterized protein METZ01_LOCUS360844, partial [marine metagenome]